MLHTDLGCTVEPAVKGSSLAARDALFQGFRFRGSARTLRLPSGWAEHSACRACNCAGLCSPEVVLLQFAQRPPTVLPIADLATAATRFFDAELTLVDSAQQPLPPEVSLLFQSARFGAIVFSARPRAASAADYQRLEPAQAANNSYGMADLGRRCPSVWQVTAQDSEDQAAFFYFGALLASVALGPLLVEGHPGLYGVRSARLRCDALDKPDA